METCTYFLIAVVLFLIALGATGTVAASATFAVAAVMFCGGLVSKFVLR